MTCHLSSSAYEVLRETGVVKLPSQRTLCDYTYVAKAVTGFSHEVDSQLSMVPNIDSCPEREKHVIILMDEMHIRKDILHDHNTGVYVNYLLTHMYVHPFHLIVYIVTAWLTICEV